MDLPASAAQLVIALLFIVPGSIYQAVRQRLRGPAPDDVNFSNKLFRALGVSTALMAIYVALLGRALLPLVEQSSAGGPSWQGALRHASALGWTSIGLLLVVPALLAFCDYVRVSGSIRMYIRCDDVRAVELLRQPVASDDDAEEDPHGQGQERLVGRAAERWLCSKDHRIHRHVSFGGPKFAQATG